MPTSDPPARSGGVVFAYVPDDHPFASEHERVSLLEFARRLAELKGCGFGGMYVPPSPVAAPVYFVPSCTLTGKQAVALRIRGPHDLFGGVVPHAFVATKAISHPLLDGGTGRLEPAFRGPGRRCSAARLHGVQSP